MPARRNISPLQMKAERILFFKECAVGGVWAREGYSPNRRAEEVEGRNTNHSDEDSLPTVTHSIQYS